MPPIETKAQLIDKLLVPFTGKGTLARCYLHYTYHDGFGRNKIYNALVRKKRK